MLPSGLSLLSGTALGVRGGVMVTPGLLLSALAFRTSASPLAALAAWEGVSKFRAMRQKPLCKELSPRKTPYLAASIQVLISIQDAYRLWNDASLVAAGAFIVTV